MVVFTLYFNRYQTEQMNLMSEKLWQCYGREEKDASVEWIFDQRGLGAEWVCRTRDHVFELAEDGPEWFECLSGWLAEYALNDYRTQFMRQWVRSRYTYGEDDIDKVMAYCDPDRGAEHQPVTHSMQKIKDRISASFRAYVEAESTLNVDGFIRFRLKDVVQTWVETIEYAVDEYMMDKQYQEFITLLKYFVHAQEVKAPSVHLIHKGNYEFMLFDEHMEPMETLKSDGMIVEKLENDMNYEDMIVTSLITISPETIYIHTRETDLQVIQTICQIFEHRTILCESCPLCHAASGEHSPGKKRQHEC